MPDDPKNGASKSIQWSVLITASFIVPFIAIGFFPDPGTSIIGTKLNTNPINDWESINETLDVVSTGQDVIYQYWCDAPGPAGNTYLYEPQATMFSGGGIEIAGDFSNNNNNANTTEPCTTNPTGFHLSIGIDIMEYRFKFGPSLSSFVSTDPTDLDFTWDFSSFGGSTVLNAAIVGWSQPSIGIANIARQISWFPVGFPIDNTLIGSTDAVLTSFTNIGLTGSINYDFTAADVIELGLIPSNTVTGISVMFFWTGTPNRVADTLNSFDFDARLTSEDSVPILQVSTFDSFLIFFFMWEFVIALGLMVQSKQFKAEEVAAPFVTPFEFFFGGDR